MELLRPLTKQILEEKKALDYTLIERAHQHELADLKKKQATGRKQLGVEIAQRKKAMLAEQKGKLKELKKKGKEEKAAAKLQFEKDIQAMEEGMVKEFEDKEKENEQRVLEEQRKKMADLEENWRAQNSRIDGLLLTLFKEREVSVVRKDKNKAELFQLIEKQRLEMVSTLELSHREREDHVKKRLQERLRIYRTQSEDMKLALGAFVKDCESHNPPVPCAPYRELLSTVGAKEEQYLFEQEQVLETEKMVMQNEIEVAKQTAKHRNEGVSRSCV